MTATDSCIVIACPGCQTRYRLPAEKAGARLRCKKCQSIVNVPSPGAKAGSSPASVPMNPAPVIVRANAPIQPELHRVDAPPGGKTAALPPPTPVKPRLDGDQPRLELPAGSPLPPETTESEIVPDPTAPVATVAVAPAAEPTPAPASETPVDLIDNALLTEVQSLWDELEAEAAAPPPPPEPPPATKPESEPEAEPSVLKAEAATQEAAPDSTGPARAEPEGVIAGHSADATPEESGEARKRDDSADELFAPVLPSAEYAPAATVPYLAAVGTTAAEASPALMAVAFARMGGPADQWDAGVAETKKEKDPVAAMAASTETSSRPHAAEEPQKDTIKDSIKDSAGDSIKESVAEPTPDSDARPIPAVLDADRSEIISVEALLASSERVPPTASAVASAREMIDAPSLAPTAAPMPTPTPVPTPTPTPPPAAPTESGVGAGAEAITGAGSSRLSAAPIPAVFAAKKAAAEAEIRDLKAYCTGCAYRFLLQRRYVGRTKLKCPQCDGKVYVLGIGDPWPDFFAEMDNEPV